MYSFASVFNVKLLGNMYYFLFSMFLTVHNYHPFHYYNQHQRLQINFLSVNFSHTLQRVFLYKTF